MIIILLSSSTILVSCRFVAFSTNGILQLYMMKIAIYNDGLIDYSLRFKFENVSLVQEFFEIDSDMKEIAFKVYNDSKLYVVLENAKTEYIEDIIEKLNQTLLSIYEFSIINQEPLYLWISGKSNFSVSTEKIASFIRNLREEIVKYINIYKCSYISVSFKPSASLSIEFGFHDNLYRFMINKNTYYLNVSALKFLSKSFNLTIVPTFTIIKFLPIRNFKLLDVYPLKYNIRKVGAIYENTTVIEWQNISTYEMYVKFKANLGYYPQICGGKEVYNPYLPVRGTFSYAIKLMNHGSKTAVNVIIEDYLPKDISLVTTLANITCEVLSEVVFSNYLWEKVYEKSIELNVSNGKIVFRIPSIKPHEYVVIGPIVATSNKPTNVTIPPASITYKDENGTTYSTKLNSEPPSVEFYKREEASYPFELVVSIVIVMFALWIYYELRVRPRKHVRRRRKWK